MTRKADASLKSDKLVTVFKDGEIFANQTFDDIRANAADGLAALAGAAADYIPL
jgi:hypothetical protein